MRDADLSSGGFHRASGHVGGRPEQVADRGWFRKVPSAQPPEVSASASSLGGFRRLRAGGLGAAGRASPCCPIVITVAVDPPQAARGPNLDGRAICDQVEGFKTYLATAEAHQFRFEEGRGHLFQYLPWAIVFELADRWAKVCADLVAMGRLPAQPRTGSTATTTWRRSTPAFLTSSLDQRGNPGALGGHAAVPASAAAARSAAGDSPAAVVVVVAAEAGEFG